MSAGEDDGIHRVLHVGRPNIGNRARLHERLDQILDSRWLTNDGPLVREFESAVAKHAGVQHCVATSSATFALDIVPRALGLKGEVIVPSFTFVAAAHALRWQGITPVFADIDRTTHNIDPESVERLITPRTTGILGVHLWGAPCDIENLEDIAHRHALKIFYDAAHAFGASQNGSRIGGFGECEILSFHATKFVNSFEGGAVVTDDDELADQLRLMRNFGFRGYDRVLSLGMNGKMSEMHAAMGLTSLEAIDQIVAINKANYDAYAVNLAGLAGITLIQFKAAATPNYQYVVIEIDPAEAGRGRDEIVAALHAKGIMARKYFWPGCHRMEPYLTEQPAAGDHLPVTELVASRVIVLPTGQSVDDSTVRRICETIRAALAA